MGPRFFYEEEGEEEEEEEKNLTGRGKKPQVSFERERLRLDWQLAMLSRVHHVKVSGRNFLTL